MSDKKQITIRINVELLQRLRDKFPYLDNDSEIIRLAMIILDSRGL